MTTADRKEREYKVQAVERALDILECFSLQDRELNLSEVATKTGLNKTTAKRLISNLTERGYLKKLDSKHYQLGLRLFELGGIVHSSLNLREATSAPMSQIQKETGATILLGTIMEDQLALIEQVGTHAVSFIQELLRFLFKANLFNLVRRTEALVQFGAVPQVFHFNLRKSTTLAGFYVRNFHSNPQAVVMF